MVTDLFRRSSIDDRQLLTSIDNDKFSLSDLGRRARGIKEEISKIFSQENSLTVAEKVHIAETQIRAFSRLVEEALGPKASNRARRKVGALSDELKLFVKDQSLKLQTEGTEKAFREFLQLEETKKYLENTLTRWKSMSGREVVETLPQEDFSIPHFDYLIGKRISERRGELQKEVELLNSLVGQKVESSSLQGSLPKGLLNSQLEVLAGQVDHFLEEAKATRSLAQKMATAKSSIQRGTVLMSEIQQGDLAALESLYLQLKSKLEEYDPSNLDELLEGFSTLLARAKQKVSGEAGIAPIARNFERFQGNSFNFLYTGIWNDLDRYADLVSKLGSDFERFQEIEKRFLERDFQGLTIESFERAPDKLYGRLKEIILQKLQPLLSKGHSQEEITVARSYKKAVREWLKQVGMPSIFKMKELKTTWGDRLQTFFSWISSLFSRTQRVNEGEGLLAHYRRRSLAPQA